MERQYDNIYFTTATVLDWMNLLKNDEIKDILVEAFRFAVKEDRARFWAFVIMENHIHLVWQILEPYDIRFVMRNLLKYVSHQIIEYHHDRNMVESLALFMVNKKDRQYQIWKRNNRSVKLHNDFVLWQKINYIHRNRSKKGEDDINYKYSSARYYATGEKDWDFLVSS